MRGIRKSFGRVVALDDVDLVIKKGEVRGLLGGNGAGKTTLMNILYGLYRADAGSIRVGGTLIPIHSPPDAIRAGIGMVHQQFLQVNRFSVAENIVLGTRLQNRPVMQLEPEKERIGALSRHFGLPVDPDAIVGGLPMGVRQRVEILKALYRGAKILVLDEPTTNLTPQEVDALFASLRAMVQEGLSVIFITHKLREALAACDAITVLRHGRSVLTLPRQEATEERLVQAMVGQDLDVKKSLLFAGQMASHSQLVREKPVLCLENVSIGPANAPGVKGCSLVAREGEIVGIAGIAGNGQLELAEGILGLRPLAGGQITIDGANVAELGTRGLLARGVAYIPEDRWLDGFLPGANVAQNLILGLHRQPPYSDGRFLHWRTIFRQSRDLMDEFKIKAEGPGDTAGNLSGGNIQRVMLARAFSQPVRLLIAHNPTRGLDIASMEFVYRKILERAEAGMATLLISENMDELFLLCHRVVALCNREVMGILERGGAAGSPGAAPSDSLSTGFDPYALGRMMSGVRQDE